MITNTFLKRITKSLEESEIPYMLSGSMASSFYGDPRTTHDIDIVIQPTVEKIHKLVNLIGNSAYISLEAATSALEHKSMFNIIDYGSGWKADLIVCKDRPFSIEELSRRQKAKVFDTEIFIVSPEDSILSKLEWAKKSTSQRQYSDLFSIASVKRNTLDFEYIKKWAVELEVEDVLKKLLLDLENHSTKKEN